MRLAPPLMSSNRIQGLYNMVMVCGSSILSMTGNPTTRDPEAYNFHMGFTSMSPYTHHCKYFNRIAALNELQCIRTRQRSRYAYRAIMFEMYFGSPERWVQNSYSSVISLKLRICKMFCQFHCFSPNNNCYIDRVVLCVKPTSTNMVSFVGLSGG